MAAKKLSRFGPHGHERIRASSWSLASTEELGRGTPRQPHLFYRAKEVDASVDELKKAHRKDAASRQDRLEFERRRFAALEAFYLRELGRD